jgi:class 3 adenylate cyclase/predicted ATPase
MKCPKCQFENREGAGFCSECGHKFELICPKCKAIIRAESKFCDACGYDLKKIQKAPPIDYNQPQSYTPKHLANKILNNRSAIEGERKLVTVLFADVANYSSIAEKLDPEEIHGIMDGCFKILMDEIHKYEGTINQFTGDGVMALFGAPITHEDHAVRALHAALGIQASLRKYGKEIEHQWGQSFQMRLGLNTGLVVVGRIGDNLRMDYTASGDATNLAARLQQMAPAASVFVGEATYRLAEKAFEWQAKGRLDVKGKTEPMLVYELTGRQPARSRFEILAQRGLTPFVGRQIELSVLKRQFEKTKQEQGQVVEIVGEAGVGKSRILHEFRQSLEPEVAYLEGQCLPYGGASAYQPLIEILRQHWSLPEKITDQVQESIAEKLNGLRDYLPCFEDLLSLPASDPNYIQLSTQMRRDKIFEALIKLFQKIAEDQQLVLAIEDLHWIDQISKEFISAFMDAIRKHQIFLILLSRPEFRSPWTGHSSCRSLSLPLLPESEDRRLVQAMFDAPVAPQLEKFIIEHTEGNPFFAEELILTLHETEAVKRNGSYSLSISPENLKIPETVQGVLAARIDNLDENTKKILQVASVIGREFTLPILRKALEVNGSLRRQLDLLCESEFIFSQQSHDSTYLFKHSLTRDVAYETLLRSRRRQLHQQIGNAIKEVSPDIESSQPEILAHHFTEAGDPAQAIPLWTQAGQKAIQRCANADAISHITKGLDLLNTLPDISERAQQELLLQTTRGAAFVAAKGYGAPEVGETFGRARELCRQVGETPLLLPSLRGICFYYLIRENMHEAQVTGEQLLASARQAQDSSFFLEAYHVLGIASFHMAKFSTAKDYLKKAIDLYDPQQHHTLADLFGSADTSVSIMSYISCGLSHSGFPDQALKKIEECLNFAKKIEHLSSLLYAQSVYAMIHQYHQEAKAAYEWTKSTMAIDHEYGFLHGLAWDYVLQGWALALLGEGAEGIHQIRRGLDIYRTQGSKLSLPTLLGHLAEACLVGGRPEDGLAAVEEAFREVNNRGEAWWSAELHRLKGELLLYLSENNQAESESCFNHAIAFSKKQGTKFFELQATISLTKLLMKQGKNAEAKNILGKIYNWFTEGFDTKVLKEARNLLEELA